jgi:hypothetical protein
MTNTTKIIEISTFFIQSIFKDVKSQINSNNGYYVGSTANLDIESIANIPGLSNSEDVDSENLKNLVGQLNNSNTEKLSIIAKQLIQSKKLVIAIHGYSVTEKSAKDWYHSIYNYINRSDSGINKSVFIGYRWPAENFRKTSQDDRSQKIDLGKVKFAFQALPTLLLGLLLSTFTFGVIVYSLLTQSLPIFIALIVLTIAISVYLAYLGKALNLSFVGFAVIFLSLIGISLKQFDAQPWLLGVLIALSTLLGAQVVTLILLRLSTYPRDRHRASNYGVLDLVEIIRQIDKALVEELGEEALEKPENKIELSFLAHSLGCEILVQAVRILSDVFDPLATDKTPTQKLGKSFLLSRLVLVAPDIPLESILPGRANFLNSSLRRCKEAYIFCNEGDLALRLASTAANYFSFPARTRFRGYKLGNITARHFKCKDDTKGRAPRYGFIQLNEQEETHEYLEVRASRLEHLKPSEMDYFELYKQLVQADNTSQEHRSELVVNLFTYFDCTDYIDNRVKYVSGAAPEETLISKGVVSHALKKPALNFLDYARLLFGSGNPEKLESIDSHSGYFRGKLSQDLIYGLAFLGFEEFLIQHHCGSFESFDKQCREKQIQVIPSRKQFFLNNQSGAIVWPFRDSFTYSYPNLPEKFSFSHQVYYAGQGPAVLLMHEIQGMSERCLQPTLRPFNWHKRNNTILNTASNTADK